MARSPISCIGTKFLCYRTKFAFQRSVNLSTIQSTTFVLDQGMAMEVAGGEFEILLKFYSEDLLSRSTR